MLRCDDCGEMYNEDLVEPEEMDTCLFCGGNNTISFDPDDRYVKEDGDG